MVEMCKTSDSEDRLKHAKLMLEGLGTGGGGIDAMPWFLVSISVPQMEEAPLHHTPHHHHHHHHHHHLVCHWQQITYDSHLVYTDQW